jgi:hypothetical protein
MVNIDDWYLSMFLAERRLRFHSSCWKKLLDAASLSVSFALNLDVCLLLLLLNELHESETKPLAILLAIIFDSSKSNLI